MKLKLENPIRIQKALGWTLTVCAVALCLCGCSSAGYRKGDTAAVSMQSAAGQVQAESQVLQRTMDALKALAQQPDGDLEVGYRQFSSELSKLAASARRTEATGNRMVQRARQYFKRWDQNLQGINYERIREASEARMTEVKVQTALAALNSELENSSARLSTLSYRSNERASRH
jgi:hypothetical protein